MEVKECFQKSEVGVIPIDWEVVPIEKFAKLINGRAYAISEWKNQGTPVIRLQNLTGSGNTYYYSNLKLPEKQYCNFGDLLFMWSATFGPIIWRGERAIYHYHIWKIETESQKLDKGLLFYILSELTERVKTSSTNGGTMLHLTKGNMEAMLIPIPPTLAEQIAIATALNDADALITQLEKLISKKRAIKQGAMQELLNPKEDWEAKKFGELTEKIIGGGTPSRSNPIFWGNEIPWVTVKDFATFNAFQTQEYVTKEGLKNSASHLIPKGTIITSTRMALGKAVIYEVDVCINQDLKAIFPQKDIDTKYLFYWFQYNSKRIEDMGSGSTVMGLSLVDLRQIKIEVPTSEIQAHIAQILSDMDAEIEVLEKKLEKTRSIKQGMMQELLTGRIRLI